MVNRILTTTLLATALSSTLAALDYTPPKIYECDAPGTEGYYLSDQEVPFDSAAAACHQTGGALADANNHNFLLLSDLVRVCIGENRNAWLRSWDFNPTNPEDRRCLALSVGHSGPGGGINPGCNINHYALCSVDDRRTHAIANNGNFGDSGKVVTVTKTVTLGDTGEPTMEFFTFENSLRPTTEIVSQESVSVSAPTPAIEFFTFENSLRPTTTSDFDSDSTSATVTVADTATDSTSLTSTTVSQDSVSASDSTPALQFFTFENRLRPTTTQVTSQGPTPESFNFSFSFDEPVDSQVSSV